MHQLLLIVQLLIAVGLIGLVLLQQGRGADAGAAFGSGGAGSVFGSRGPATLLVRLTALLAAMFFANSIGLAYLALQQSRETRSVMENVAPETTQSVPTSPGAGQSGLVSDVPQAPSDTSSTPASSDVPDAPASGSESPSDN